MNPARISRVSAAAAFTTVRGAGDEVLATTGALVLAAWVAVTFGASVLVITRRDAQAASRSACDFSRTGLQDAHHATA